MDGNGSVVDWTPLDRDVQHECADSHQRTSASPGRSRGQNLREGLGTSVVDMATALLERSGERQVGRTASKAVQNLQMGGYGVDGGIQSLWERRWFRKICTTVDRLAATCPESRAMAAVRESPHSACGPEKLLPGLHFQLLKIRKWSQNT